MWEITVVLADSIDTGAPPEDAGIEGGTCQPAEERVFLKFCIIFS